MNILERWVELCERFDGLVVRERLLLFGSCLAGIYLIFDTLFIIPAGAEVDRLKTEAEAIDKRSQQIASEKKVFDKLSARDPDANLKREQLKLQGKLLQLEGSLDELQLRLVPSDKLPQILQSVSTRAEKVKLKSIQTLSPEGIDLAGRTLRLASIGEATKNFVQGEGDAQADKVYRHGIVLEMSGGYFQIMDFLKALESLEWRFYWERMDYQVEQYPNASVYIELYTLSTDEGMLGGG